MHIPYTLACCSDISIPTSHAAFLGYLRSKLPAGGSTEPDLIQVSNADLLRQFLKFMEVIASLCSIHNVRFISIFCRTNEALLQELFPVTANLFCTP